MRAITHTERERAFKRLVQPSMLSRSQVASTLRQAGSDYDVDSSLADALQTLSEKSSALEVGELYVVWGAVSRALDLGCESGEIEDLEGRIGFLVRSAWDDEMYASDLR